MTDNMRGATFMMASMATFTLNDACMKWLAQDLPTFQIVTLRGLVATALLIVIAHVTGALAQPVPRGDRRRVALRVAAEVCAFLPFIIALTHMPLANITAILQVLPLTIAAAGAVFLREKVGPRRWTAIAIGLVGVLLIVRPGTEGFNQWSLLAISTVIIITARELLTRKLSPAVPTLKVATFTAAGVTVLGALLSTRTAWEMPSTGQGGLVGLAAIFVLLAYLTSILAMRAGEMSAVAPFRYSAMLWGLLLGALVFGERPDALTLTGAGLILAAGMFTLWRDGRVPRPLPH